MGEGPQRSPRGAGRKPGGQRAEGRGQRAGGQEGRRQKGPRCHGGRGWGVNRPPLSSVVGVPSPPLTLGLAFSTASPLRVHTSLHGPWRCSQAQGFTGSGSLRDARQHKGIQTAEPSSVGGPGTAPRQLNELGRRTSVLLVSSSVKCGRSFYLPVLG